MSWANLWLVTRAVRGICLMSSLEQKVRRYSAVSMRFAAAILVPVEENGA